MSQKIVEIKKSVFDINELKFGEREKSKWSGYASLSRFTEFMKKSNNLTDFDATMMRCDDTMYSFDTIQETVFMQIKKTIKNARLL